MVNDSMAMGPYEKTRHLEEAHKWLECNSINEFCRVDHTKQHLEHSRGCVFGERNKLLTKPHTIEDASQLLCKAH